MGIANIVNAKAVTPDLVTARYGENIYYGGDNSFSLKSALALVASNPANKGLEASPERVSELAMFYEDLHADRAMLPGVETRNISAAYNVDVTAAVRALHAAGISPVEEARSI